MALMEDESATPKEATVDLPTSNSETNDSFCEGQHGPYQ